MMLQHDQLDEYWLSAHFDVFIVELYSVILVLRSNGGRKQQILSVLQKTAARPIKKKKGKVLGTLGSLKSSSDWISKENHFKLQPSIVNYKTDFCMNVIPMKNHLCCTDRFISLPIIGVWVWLEIEMANLLERTSEVQVVLSFTQDFETVKGQMFVKWWISQTSVGNIIVRPLPVIDLVTLEHKPPLTQSV